MTQYGFYYNNLNCTGCRTCQVACKDKNDLDPGILFRRVSTYETGEYPNPGYYHLSISCNHCADPACVKACPIEANYKDDETGIVMHDDEICIGCQACQSACPYGHPQYLEAESIVHKCMMCHDLILEGGRPACVDACPMRCLEWGDIDELAAKHPEAVNDIAVLPDSSVTTPSMIMTARPAAFEDNPLLRSI